MIHVITNYYVDSSPARQREIDTCLVKNLTNPGISMISILLEEKDVETLQAMLFSVSNSLFDKVTLVIGEGRPTYNNFFSLASKKGDSQTVHILLNSDIYIDMDSTPLFEGIQDGSVWALSRWEIPHNGKPVLYNHRDSQDVWVWRGKMEEITGAEFNIGVPGCDNRIAKLFVDAGFTVLNPSKTVRCIHLHHSQKRNYNRSMTVQPPYHFIQPHELEWIPA